MIRFPLILALALSTVLTLSACESSEERAQKHFESALELIDAGDVDRALVELRNVFKFNETHREARQAYARLQRDRGDNAAAYGQYLRLVEQYPDDLEGLRALSEIALSRMDWPSFDRFVPRTLALDPEDLSLQAMQTLVDYRAARVEKDDVAAAQAVAAAEMVLAQSPDESSARQVLLDQDLRQMHYSSALEEVDALLALTPDNMVFNEFKLRILGTLEDMDAFGSHLEEMITRFPDNEQIRGMLISYYISENRLDSAEAFLRQLAETAAPGRERRSAEATLVQFIQRTRGNDDAIAEIDQLIATRDETLSHQTMRAALVFQGGDSAAAITALRAAIEATPQSPQINDGKVALAGMLVATGDAVGARALVEEVIAADASHVAALQMQAAWLIEDDRTGEAIQALRAALDQAPRNPRTLTLLAEAQLREGNRELAGERLSLAVEASDGAPGESLRYADFLVSMDRGDGAEQVLLASLRRHAGHAGLLNALGTLYLQQGDWLGAEGVIRSLEEIATPTAQGMANNLRNTLLLRQNRTDESITFLQDLIDQGDVRIGASALVVQNMLRGGQIEEAETYLQDMLANDPDNRTLRFVRAGLHVATGQIASAEEIYRALIAQEPRDTTPILALFSLLSRTGQPEAAEQMLDDGIAATDGDAQLRFAKAGLLEAAGDIEQAIAIYEDLYADNTGNPLLANNLASMITTYRDDEESLRRATAVAQRLRGTDVPAFQDTYGWIEYRRGNFDVAVEYLEPAAAGLPEDATVQMHLGLAYVAAERPEEARIALTRALSLAGDPLPPRFQQAQAALAALPAAPAQGAAPAVEDDQN